MKQLETEYRATTKQAISLGSLASGGHTTCQGGPALDLGKKQGSRHGLSPKWDISGYVVLLWSLLRSILLPVLLLMVKEFLCN